MVITLVSNLIKRQRTTVGSWRKISLKRCRKMLVGGSKTSGRLKRLSLFILISASLMTTSWCSTKTNGCYQANLCQKCQVDNLPLLKDNTGIALSDMLDWYQMAYGECAKNHNGLVESLR